MMPYARNIFMKNLLNLFIVKGSVPSIEKFIRAVLLPREFYASFGVVGSRFCNAQIPANFSGEEAVDFRVARDGGSAPGFPTMSGSPLRGRAGNPARPDGG